MNPLKDLEWNEIVERNKMLCLKAGYQHGRTSEGYQPAKELFKRESSKELDLAGAIEVLRQLHKVAPFLFLNGNTFSQIGRELMTWHGKSAALRSIVGHHIAGTAVLNHEELKTALEPGKEE
jgi:hypothetical protein